MSSFIREGSTLKGMGAATIPPVIFQNDAAMLSGQTFLQGQLEKFDPTLNEPLKNITWARDIYAETGGGYSQFSSAVFVDYATTGTNEYGIVAGDTNVIPVIQANISKDIYRVHNFMNIISLPFMDQKYFEAANYAKSLQSIFEDGLKINWDKAIDRNVYLGFTDYGTYGLVNSPLVTAYLSPANGTASSRKWSAKTPQQILDDINDAIDEAWAASEYDPSGIPNQILIPPSSFTHLVKTMVNIAANYSIMSFLLENNLAKANGVQLVIAPCRQTIGVGVETVSGEGPSNRMVCYVNAKNRVSFEIPVPLTRSMTQAAVMQMSFLTGYVAQISEVKFKYLQCINYTDGI